MSGAVIPDLAGLAALTLEQGAALTRYREVCAQAWADLFRSESFLADGAQEAAERCYAALAPDGAIAQAFAAVVAAFGGSLAAPAWVYRLMAQIRADDGLPELPPVPVAAGGVP